MARVKGPTGWKDLTRKESRAKARIQKLEVALARKKATLIRAKGSLSEVERKARVRRLIRIGALVDLAGPELTDAGFFVGCLLRATSIPPSSKRWKALKVKGDAFLRRREAERAKKT